MTARQVPRSLRVLHLDAAREWRGGERQLLLLAKGLRARGIEPLVAARPGTPLLHRLKAEGLAAASLAMRSSLDLLAVRRLRRLIATWRPHLLHAHDARSHALALAALVGRRRSVPLVVTRRSAAPPRALIRFGPRVARFVAISEAVRTALRDGHVPDARIVVAYPGVFTRAAESRRDWRAECGWPADVVVAGLIGPVALERETARLDALLGNVAHAAAARLAIVVLGGHATGRGELAGVRLYRAGYVHDVPHALAGLDLLLHPGGAEGMGTAVVEAMALGVPTVAFATWGLAEIIEDRVNGVLVPAADLVAFARATGELVTDRAVREALGGAGPARARRFSPEEMVDTIEAAYRDVLERSAV